MDCSHRILRLLEAHNIDGHDKPGGTDKNTSHSYVEVYGKILAPFVSKKGTLLEIGVQYGGSSLLWQELLPNFNFCFVDNEDKLHQTIKDKLDHSKSTFLVRDGYSQETKNEIKDIYNNFDVIIDDGPHTLESQKLCIQLYLDLLNPGGILIIEDIQQFEIVEELKFLVPVGYIVDVYDLRSNKNRYDDIIITITKNVIYQKNNIAVFYHVGQFGQWERLFQEQINSLCISGLYHAADLVYVGINGDLPMPDKLEKMTQVYNSNKILEANTLEAMWNFCKQNPDYRVMYFHTKGSTQEDKSFRYGVDAWRLYLEYFVIHQWKKCVQLLNQYDTVGTEYNYETGLINQDSGETIWEQNPHYAGNFWWANASYINKLDPNYLYNTLYGWTRYRSEFWIGTGNPNRYNFFHTGVFDKYTERNYTPLNYVIEEPYIEPDKIIESDMLKNKKKKIVMITMFKNEANTIKRMLESCYKYIDYYVIQDNGSTDGTPEIVKEFFADKNIPGFVYKVEKWVSFGWNRDHLLQTCLKAKHGCDWIMKMDCDEVLEVDDDFDWSAFDDTNIHSFHVTAISGGTFYHRAWIWNARLQWKFNHDTAHETIELLNDNIGPNFRRVDLPRSFRQIGGFNDGESYQNPAKYICDALRLEEKLIKEDTMLSDLYHFWYVGKSYYDGYRTSSLPLKEKHKNHYALSCIFYCEEYLNVTHNFEKTQVADRIDEMAYYAMLMIGNSYRFLNQHEKAINYLKQANMFCPRRNEHIVNLAECYNDLSMYEQMLEVTKILLDKSRTNPFPEFTFIIDANSYYDTGNYVSRLHEIASKHSEKSFNIFGVNK